MDHPSLIRRVCFVLLSGAWLFLLLSLGSFHANDWPSHAVFPYPPIQNVMGAPGAFVAYYMYLTMGQGIFPVLFFTGVCVALYTYGGRISDLWLRTIALLPLPLPSPPPSPSPSPPSPPSSSPAPPPDSPKATAGSSASAPRPSSAPTAAAS